jgi:hypothetical protein
MPARRPESECCRPLSCGDGLIRKRTRPDFGFHLPLLAMAVFITAQNSGRTSASRSALTASRPTEKGLFQRYGFVWVERRVSPNYFEYLRHNSHAPGPRSRLAAGASKFWAPQGYRNSQGCQDLEFGPGYAQKALEVRSLLVQNGPDEHGPDRGDFAVEWADFGRLNGF